MPHDEERLLAFAVDTSLVRQLGELLVGRNSTALVELLKNAYDADATRVVVSSDALQQGGSLSISDDGSGMSESTFETSFLRIGGSSRRKAGRYSEVFHRRFTGAKGIGRLSAHKLSEQLVVESTFGDSAFMANISWDAIENSDLSMEQTQLIHFRRLPAGGPGTTLRLLGLRSSWSKRATEEFLAELASSRPDRTLTGAIPASLGVELQNPEVRFTDSSATDPGMEVEFFGALAVAPSAFPELLAHVNWVIELQVSEGLATCRVSPTNLTVDRVNTASRDFEWPVSDESLSYSARIFVRDEGARGDRLPPLVARFARDTAGVRVYLEGFRVLPYGAPGDDWLSVSRDATRRNSLTSIDFAESVPHGTDERTYQLSASNYFGGVFLTEAGAPGLEMVINREGFVPAPSFDSITQDVRRAIDLSVRVRAAAGAENARIRAEERRKKTAKPLVPESQEDSDARLRTSVRAVTHTVSSARATGVSLLTPEVLEQVEETLDEVSARLETISTEAQQQRVLASLGSQAAAFVHEVTSLLAQARGVEATLASILDSEELSPPARKRLSRVLRSQQELVTGFERQAVYLTDTMGADARRRRSSQDVAQRYESAMRLLLGAANQREVRVTSKIEPGLATGPMFASELSVILSNLLSNAIKAASESTPGKVLVTGSREADSALISVSNTGVAVQLEEADRWFKPFESTTSNVDDLLGQGLGLGLTLTRRIVEDYGGSIKFVRPRHGYQTTIEVRLPGK